MILKELHKTFFFNGLVFCFFFSIQEESFSQAIYQPYSYSLYQKLNSFVFSPRYSIHTGLKPYILNDLSPERRMVDSLISTENVHRPKNLVNRILFYGHLVDIKEKDYSFFLDFIPDFQIGREFIQPTSVFLNTRGYQLGGTIGPRFFFYSSGYENQGKFPNYQASYIKKTGQILGQAYDRSKFGIGTDWSYVTAIIGFDIAKKVHIVLGEDKTFIGDGYRSILLSDYASAYPFLRVNFNLTKNIEYTAMWAYLEDQNAPQFNSFFNNRRKWGVFHFIDWNITKTVSLGFFNALIAEEASDLGKYHGFDVNYINPLIFISSLGPSNPAPDHTLLGFNGKYKILNQTLLYGQLLLDQGSTNSINSGRNAWQIGLRGSDFLKINKLNYLLEYNSSKPYTYTDRYPITNYAQLSEPLAHPLGSNFRELIGVINYSKGKFDFQGQINIASYGLDKDSLNYGKDITLANNSRLPLSSGKIGQGLNTSLRYLEGTASYLLNPKYNLRIEINGLLRQESNVQSKTNTALITIGLRSSFRNLYHDF